ncbi:MAG TPA: 6-pyruvoyl-tetrahydropterin synthase-related protein [Candidatus Sulfotelmatobacter sp.]|nr:6-pyruvoyl-tetrahydropterin synthase-related protein [Candidatus Sulfotelmatobacter sp.]
MRRNLERIPTLLWTPLLAIGAAVFAVEIPFFFLGTPSGHDVEFHLYSWLEVLNQWHHGIWYPRWAALAHFGYGEPRFVFYPPASWMLGSLISTVVPWRIASPVFIWVVLVLAGASMFLLVRRWFSRPEATFAAVLYAVNPYHLVIVYWRSAFAEMLASCLIPVLLLLILKAADGERRLVVPLGILLAASWLTNAPAAVMIHYSLALLILIFAWKRKSLHLIWIAAGAVVIGALLSAFYLLPAVYEQRWVDIANAISPGSRPVDNFLFIHTTDPDHDAFNRIISWVAALEIGSIFLSAAIRKLWRAEKREIWNTLAIWAAACSVLMFPISLVLWEVLPKLQFMQFPWRWLLCLSVIFAIFVTVALRQWWARALVFAVSVLLIVAAWHQVQAPWWDNASDLREMQDNMSDRIGYEGTDEYTPVGADPSVIDKDARNVTVNGPAKAAIHVQRWDAETKLFTADLSAPDRLNLKLFPYPAWKVTVNGHEVKTALRSGSGQMLVPVAAGMNRIEIRFTRTWDRTAGGWISVLTLLGIAGWIFIARQRGHLHQSHLQQKSLG